MAATSPNRCDLCQAPLQLTYVDGATRRTGQWANMDPLCHRLYGVGLGIGRGQRYERAGLTSPWTRYTEPRDDLVL
jgi:hypothetical protein